MREKLKKIISGTYVKNILFLGGGTLASQIINSGSILAYSRLFSLKDFGELTIVTSTTAILSTFYTLKLDHSIVQDKSLDSAEQTTSICLYISLLFTAISVIALMILSHFNILVDSYFFAISIALNSFFVSMNTTLIQYFTRQKMFSFYTKKQVVSTLLACTSTITIGLFLNDILPNGLLIGLLIGNAMYFLLLIRRYEPSLFMHNSLHTIIAQIKKLKSYPIILFPSSFIERISQQIHIYLISSNFGNIAVAPLGIYNKSVSLPQRIIGSSIREVFKQRAVEDLETKGTCRVLLWKNVMFLFSIGLIPFLILLIFGPEIFSFVLGAKWAIAGEYAQILSPVFLFGLCVSPISGIFYIDKNQKFDLYLQVILILALTILMLTTYNLTKNINYTLMAYSGSYCLKYCFELYWADKLSHNGKKYD